MNQDRFVEKVIADDDIYDYIEKNKGYFPIEFTKELEKKHEEKYAIFNELFNFGWIVAFYDLVFAGYAGYSIGLNVILGYVIIASIIPLSVMYYIYNRNIKKLIGLIIIHVITSTAIFISYTYSFIFGGHNEHKILWYTAGALFLMTCSIVIKTFILKRKLRLKFVHINK